MGLRLIRSPKPLNVNAMNAKIKQGLERFRDKKILPQFERTTRTWNRKPKFDQTFKTRGDTWEAAITTSDKIYAYLTLGTAVRYATMSADFRAKTTPNQITSRSGRGGLLFISRARPRPGIKARLFDLSIKKLLEPKFQPFMQDVFTQAIKASGHKI